MTSEPIYRINTKSPYYLLDEILASANPLYSDYHRQHTDLTVQYAQLINKKLDYIVDQDMIGFAAKMHDTFKGIDKLPKSNVHEKIDKLDFSEIRIAGNPIDRIAEAFKEISNLQNYQEPTNAYVRSNVNVLNEYDLDDYFNSDASTHGLAAGILIHKLGLQDPHIIYPIMFHSCPIYKVYKMLPITVKLAVDIIVLADKLSSNYIKMNNNRPVPIDLDAFVFGPSGKEFNFSTGVFIAKVIGNEDKMGDEAIKMTNYYREVAALSNPLVNFKEKILTSNDLGGNRLWPQRKSRVITSSEMFANEQC